MSMLVGVHGGARGALGAAAGVLLLVLAGALLSVPLLLVEAAAPEDDSPAISITEDVQEYIVVLFRNT